MACATAELKAPAGSNGGRAVPVIADRGDRAAVVVLSLPHQPRVGDRFQHDGMEWVVVRAKDHLRGAVAVPVLVRGRA
jgi:hypothetical protein